MTNQNMINYNLLNIDKPVNKIIELMSKCSIFALTGTLGAGKTTLISNVLKNCGVTDIVSSPTYTYMAIYSNSKKQFFYHFDLYRIKTLQEFFNAGFNEFLFEPNSWAFIEWPEVIIPILTTNTCFIDIDYHNNERILKYNFTSDIVFK